MTPERLLSVWPPTARARTWLTSLPEHVPEPSVSKFGLSAVKAPPARGPRHTQQVPTSIVVEVYWVENVRKIECAIVAANCAAGDHEIEATVVAVHPTRTELNAEATGRNVRVGSVPV